MSRYDVLSSDVGDFIRSRDRNLIRLSASAAEEACRVAHESRLVIRGIEGGIWLNPGFHSRIDSLWSGKEGDLSQKEAIENNLEAAQFIRTEKLKLQDGRDPPNVFILTTDEIRE